jgi:chaperonin GroES
MSSKFIPLNDYVIVQVNKSVETKTSSGLYLPESKEENITKGKVIAVGPGKYDPKGNWQTLSVKLGQTVVFNKFHGVQFSDDSNNYVALKEEFVLFYIEE